MAPSILSRLRLRSRQPSEPSEDSAPPPDRSDTGIAPTQHLYPPAALLAPVPLLNILNATQDHQLTHGSLIKRPVRASLHFQSREQPFAVPIGVALFPTPWPRRLFEDAVTRLRPLFDELYARVACDEAWLRDVTARLVEVDALPACLWGCVDAAKKMRRGWAGEGREVDEFGLGIWRSDYMLQREVADDGVEDVSLKQVEINTLSCAGGLHSNRVSNIHRHLAAAGAYEYARDQTTESATPNITLDRLPNNETLALITKGIERAHAYYLSDVRPGSPSLPSLDPPDPPALDCCVLMPVQPYNINIADERPIEYGLWACSPPVPCFRLEWQEIRNRARLGPRGELLFTPLSASSKTWEVSVVYFRASHDLHEYYDDSRVVSVDSPGARARILCEASRAIKAPTLLGHIATFKVVQQALTAPGAVERFLSADKAEAVRKTFATIYETSDDAAKQVMGDEAEVKHWILKPSLEGGGHGIFGSAIPGHMRGLSQKERNKYILLRKIEPPRMRNKLMSWRGMYEGDVVNELGVFGACLWRKAAGSDGCEILMSEPAGCSLKTKAENIDEMSVVKGYGCFDSPLLVDDDTFWKLSRAS